MQENTHVPADALVFRAIRKSRWIVDGEPQPTAFLLRSETGEKSLSILTQGECSPHYCAAIRFEKCFGEIVLTVEGFKKLGLDVVLCPEPDIPHHACVLGLPPNLPETEIEARNIAIEILKFVVQVKERRYKKPK